MWGPFVVVIKETFESTRNLLVGGDANPDPTTYPELQSGDNGGSLAVGEFPATSPPSTPPDGVSVLTSGVKYDFLNPPPSSNVFTPGTPGVPTEVDKVTKLKVADVDKDGVNDLIGTFADGTTKIYLNPGTNVFSAVTPIVIPAQSGSPPTTDVFVADVNKDGNPDIVTVSDGGTNNLYLGPIEDVAPADGVVDNPATPLGAQPDTSPSQSVDVADVDDDGDLDIIVGNLGTPNVIYFQDNLPDPPGAQTSGKFTTTTPISNAPSPTTKVVADDLDKDGKLDLVVANRDEANQIFLAKDAAGGVLTPTSLDPAITGSPAPSSTLPLPPYNNWPDGFLGAEWQDSFAELESSPLIPSITTALTLTEEQAHHGGHRRRRL